MRLARGVVVLMAIALAATGLSGCAETAKKDSEPKPLAKLGKNERELNLVAFPGYVENGSTSSDVDWVTPFERSTGCIVSIKTVNSSEEMVSLLATGGYDGAAVPGEISRQLMLDKTFAPVNTSLIPNYRGVVAGLRKKPWNSLNSQAHGVPAGRVANLLQHRSDQVQPAPESLKALYDSGASYAGKVSVRDSVLTLADAAVYAMTAQPKLKIDNPYALTKRQFSAVLKLAREQKKLTGSYWTDYVQQVQEFEQGKVVLGMSPEPIITLGQQRHIQVQGVIPSEGTTGSSDTWMLASKAKHPHCAYRWMNHVLDPTINAQIAEYVGFAPSNAQACEKTQDKEFCQTYHATDEEFYRRVYFSTTPTEQCVEGEADNCIALEQWRKEWKKIRGR